MSSPAAYVQYSSSVLEGYITFYPGDNFTYTFENGTEYNNRWIAFYNSQGPTGPLTTGGDFYNFFVLGYYPASYDPDTPDSSCVGAAATSAAASTTSAAATSSGAAAASTTDDSVLPSQTAWPLYSYPQNPDIVQPDLGNTGVLTGYFLEDISVAVLSIPSFYTDATSVANFSLTITEFLVESKEAGMQKVLIDVQQNTGGNPFSAIDAFKQVRPFRHSNEDILLYTDSTGQFFPTTEPFTGSRMRAQPAADALGNTYTNYYNTQRLNETFYYELTSLDWVATTRINAATGRNFTSWGEFFGPHDYNGDLFTTTQRLNLSNEVFDIEGSGGIVVYGYDGYVLPNFTQPYAAEDIAILTDGLCASACALFMEMMHHEAGVPTIAVGGQPIDGPMQAPAGTRGAEDYGFGNGGELDADVELAEEINSTVADYLPSSSEDVYLTAASLNLRDQIREDSNTPVQFLYEAANCRIFYRPDTWYNYTNLWKYASSAAFGNSSLCVPGSTGFATTTASNSTVAPPSLPGNINSNISYGVPGIQALSNTTSDVAIPLGFSGPQSDSPTQSSNLLSVGSLCKSTAQCARGTQCLPTTCNDNRCVVGCSTSHNTCDCQITSKGNLKSSSGISAYDSISNQVQSGSGYCKIDCVSRTGATEAIFTRPSKPFSQPPMKVSKARSVGQAVSDLFGA